MVPLKVEEYAGFVFINMDESATCVEDQLPEFAERLNQACSVIKDLKLAARFVTETPANWKVIVDNYQNVTTVGLHILVLRIRYKLINIGIPHIKTGHYSTVLLVHQRNHSSLIHL